MSKAKRKITYAAKKRFYARRIVLFCKAIACKDVSSELIDVMVDHIVAKLPAASMRRVIAGDWGRPMRDAMKLTVPFFA